MRNKSSGLQQNLKYVCFSLVFFLFFFFFFQQSAVFPSTIFSWQIAQSSGPSVLTGTPPRVYPLRGTTSSLAHCLVSGSDTICNGPGPLLANIVLYGLSLSDFPSRLWNMSARERFSHLYKRCFVLLPNQCEILTLVLLEIRLTLRSLS